MLNIIVNTTLITDNS